MNKTVVTIAFFVLVMLALVGSITVLIMRPEQLTPFITIVVTVLGLATTGAVTFYGLGKQGEQLTAQGEVIQTIQKQTNGTTTALTNQIDKQAAQIAELVSHLAASSPTSTIPTLTGEPVNSARHVAV